MKRKTATRQIADKIKKLNGMGLLQINYIASRYMMTGLCKNREEALTYMLEIESETQGHLETQWVDMNLPRKA